MEKAILKSGKNKVDKHPSNEQNLESLLCQNKFKLKPEDEISLDSIFSALLDRIEPAYKVYEKLKFEVPAKALINEKQAILFEERLYISILKDKCCQLDEKKIFLESELLEVGSFKFKAEESYDGYAVSGKSELVKERGRGKSGHWLTGKYDDKLKFLYEKRTEYDFVDNARIEKTLEARLNGGKLIVKRQTKLGNDEQHFKAVINIKSDQGVFIMEGGVLLLTRYLIVNNISGDFTYFSMNIIGKVLRCQLTINQQRTQIKMFHRTFKNVVHVRNTFYYNDHAQEVSDTFYTVAGKIILHYWHNFNYLLHETKGFVPKTERIVPQLEIMWRQQPQLLNQYRLKKKLLYENALKYFAQHPELSDFLHDYIHTVIKYKPNNLLEFSVKYFRKFKKPSSIL